MFLWGSTGFLFSSSFSFAVNFKITLTDRSYFSEQIYVYNFFYKQRVKWEIVIFVVTEEQKPTRCHLLFYCTSYRLNMFRALLCPSTGARDYNVDYHICRSFCKDGGVSVNVKL